MEPTIVEKPGFKVVGMKYRGQNEHGEIPQLWGQFVPRLGEIKHGVGRGESYGVMDNFDEASQEFDYLAAVEVDSTDDLPDGLLGWEVPAQTYAVFTVQFSSIMEGYKYAYETWLPKSEYQRVPGPEVEFYPETFYPEDGSSQLQLWVPVKRG